MEYPTATIPRLSVILHARPTPADLLGVALPPLGPLSRKAEAERTAASVLRELDSLKDPVGTELLFVDPESPEGISDHLRSIFGEPWTQGKLQLVGCEPTWDASRLRNEAASKARGAWLSFLEPGVEFQSGRLSRLEPLLRGADLILGLDGPEIPNRADWLQSFLSNQVPPTSLVPSAALIRRSLFEEIGGFRAGRFGTLIDYDLWLRALVRLRKGSAMDRLTLVPAEGLLSASPPFKPWVREGQEVLTVLSSLTSLPKGYWPTALKRVASFLLNR